MIPNDIKNTQDRLEDQILWYDTKSIACKRWFIRLKVLTLLAGSLVPLLSGFEVCAWVIGGLGVVVVVSEGIQQLLQLHPNWISYRSTCEALKHEKFLFIAKAAHYRDVPNPDQLLAERVEELVSVEHAKWVAAQEKAQQQNPKEK